MDRSWIDLSSHLSVHIQAPSIRIRFPSVFILFFVLKGVENNGPITWNNVFGKRYENVYVWTWPQIALDLATSVNGVWMAPTLTLFTGRGRCWLIHWDLKLFILFVLMNNSFVSKDVALEVAVVDSKVPNKELGHRHSKS